jgi:Spy/CpxP family protein refolding chaperone
MGLLTHSARRDVNGLLHTPLRTLTAAAFLIVLAGATASVAQAQPMPGMTDHGARMAGHQPFGGQGGPGGMLASERMLDAVGASAEQKTRVRDIFKAAQDDLRKQHESGQAMHQQMLALLAAPQIDAAAAEALRQQQSARHDAASKRMLTAMLDASAVLTPEQRQKLAERMKSRQEMMQRHHRERQGMDGAPRS